MSLGDAIDEVLDAHLGKPGEVAVEKDGNEATIDVADVDRLGVKVRGVKVRRQGARAVDAEAASLPERLRSIPERLRPVEVDPKLGGATLRTRPEDMRDREFYQVDVTESEVEVRRYRAEEGGRKPVDWVMTRGQLGRLVDELEDE